MPAPKSAPAAERTEAVNDRRAPKGMPGSIRWFKALLGRPLALERRDNKLHVALVERRRTAEVIQAESLARLREELRARLLSVDNPDTPAAMRHLVFVHDVLGHQGWPGVQAMASRVLKKAGLQVQMLQEQEPSRRLEKLVHRLRLLQTAAELREERAAKARAAGAAAPELDIEVSEASAEDFEAMQRIWMATEAAELDTAPR